MTRNYSCYSLLLSTCSDIVPNLVCKVSSKLSTQSVSSCGLLMLLASGMAALPAPADVVPRRGGAEAGTSGSDDSAVSMTFGREELDAIDMTRMLALLRGCDGCESRGAERRQVFGTRGATRGTRRTFRLFSSSQHSFSSRLPSGLDRHSAWLLERAVHLSQQSDASWVEQCCSAPKAQRSAADPVQHLEPDNLALPPHPMAPYRTYPV